MPAFTKKYPRSNNKNRIIKTDCHIFQVGPKRTRPFPSEHKFEAVWDTGATHSSIHARVVKKLGLKIVSKREISTGNGPCICNSYYVDIALPNNMMVHKVLVSELDMLPDVLIGMDIITAGDFVLYSHGKETLFSFRLPTKSDKVDFYIQAHTPHTAPEKVGRNDPCPCNSGKKYKQCCGK